MSVPVSVRTPHFALDTIINQAEAIKGQVARVRNLSALGDSPRTAYNELQRHLQRALDVWDANTSVPGLKEYAIGQYPATLDIVAEFVATRAAAIALQLWIFNNMPRHTPSGAPLLYTDNLKGQLSVLMFTSAQTADFRIEADAFLATIS